MFLGSIARGGSLTDLIFLEGFCGSTHIFTSFFQFFIGFLHHLVVTILFSLIFQLIKIAEQFLLLFAESLESSFDFLFLFLGFGLLQCGLQLFELFVDVLLTSSKFLKSIQRLAVFRLLLFLTKLCLILLLVAVAVVVELKLLQLLLRSILLRLGRRRT